MLLKYLMIKTGATSPEDLKYSCIWEDVLLIVSLDRQLCEMFSIHDWRETLLYFKGERLESDNHRDYVKRLLVLSKPSR